MFCPKCASEIASPDMEYCSNCGQNCKNIREAMSKESVQSDASKGVRTGVKLILLSLLLLPAVIFLSAMFPGNDRLVESSPDNTWFDTVGWAVIWTVALAGVIRIAYALVFERKVSTVETYAAPQQSNEIGEKRTAGALPPQREVPLGQWKTSGELFEPVFTKRKTSGDMG